MQTESKTEMGNIPYTESLSSQGNMLQNLTQLCQNWKGVSNFDSSSAQQHASLNQFQNPVLPHLQNHYNVSTQANSSFSEQSLIELQAKNLKGLLGIKDLIDLNAQLISLLQLNSLASNLDSNNNTIINTTRTNLLSKNKIFETSQQSQSSIAKSSLNESQIYPQFQTQHLNNQMPAIDSLKKQLSADQINQYLLDFYLNSIKEKDSTKKQEFEQINSYGLVSPQRPSTLNLPYLIDKQKNQINLFTNQQMTGSQVPKDRKWTPKILISNLENKTLHTQHSLSCYQKHESQIYDSQKDKQTLLQQSQIIQDLKSTSERLSSQQLLSTHNTISKSTNYSNSSNNYASNEDSTLLQNSQGSPYSKSDSLSEDSENKVSEEDQSQNLNLKEKSQTLKRSCQSVLDTSKEATKRRTMEIMKCPHKNQKHYAKGMCNHCYHKYGRNSFADACPHSDRLVYAKGKCQNCYLNDYNKQKRRMKKDRAAPANRKEGSSIVAQVNALEPPTKRIKMSNFQ